MSGRDPQSGHAKELLQAASLVVQATEQAAEDTGFTGMTAEILALALISCVGVHAARGLLGA